MVRKLKQVRNLSGPLYTDAELRDWHWYDAVIVPRDCALEVFARTRARAHARTQMRARTRTRTCMRACMHACMHA